MLALFLWPALHPRLIIWLLCLIQSMISSSHLSQGANLAISCHPDDQWRYEGDFSRMTDSIASSTWTTFSFACACNPQKRAGKKVRLGPGLVFLTFYIKLLWLNFNGRVCCSEATLWPSEYICGRLEWVCAVWYATRSPLTAAPRSFPLCTAHFNSPSFCVTETSRCADGVRFSHPSTMRTNAHPVCVSMPQWPKAGPHWVPKKAYQKNWIGKQRGMWWARNRKGSEFQWFWGFGPFFLPELHHSQELWKHEDWQAQALIYVWMLGTRVWGDAVLL